MNKKRVSISSLDLCYMSQVVGWCKKVETTTILASKTGVVKNQKKVYVFLKFFITNS